MSLFEEAAAKIAIMTQSGKGFFNHHRFARGCLTFLGVYAQEGPEICILDERWESFFEKTQKPS